MADEDQIPPHEQATVSDAFSSQPGPALPPQRRARRVRTFPLGMTMLLITAALVLIAGGLGFIVYAATTQYSASQHTQATAQVQSTTRARATALAKAQVVAQATSHALATVQAGILATATAQDGATATAAAGSDMGTATATTLEDLLSNATNGDPTLDDPLSDNTGNNVWDEGIKGNGNTGCFFTNGAYHAREAQAGFLQPCFAEATNFSNFVYQLQMTIDQGSQGGILFRANSAKGQYYLFRVGTDGSYALELYNNNGEKLLNSGLSSAVSTGIGQENDIAVIANKTLLYLYINEQFVAGVTDSALSSGQIGVAALAYSTPTEVEFGSAQVWKL